MSFNGPPKAATPETRENKKPEIHPLAIDPHAPELDAESIAILHEQWEKFWELRSTQSENEVMPEPIIKAGYLTHHAWDTSHLQNILKAGILSGELGFGEKETIAEDRETHYCADFWASDTERTVPEYIEFTRTKEKIGMLTKDRGERYAAPAPNNESVAFVVDPAQPGLEQMLKYSGTGIDKGELERFPVRFPYEKSNHVAVLVGVPANFITMILVGGKVAADSEKLQEIKTAITDAGLHIPIVSLSGERVG